MGLQLDLRQGRSFDWDLQVLNSDDSVPTGQFLGTDTLYCAVWRGSTETPLATPAIAWISPTNAQVQITFAPSDTASLTPGIYYVLATATRGSDVVDLLPENTALHLFAVPASTIPPPAYCTIQDIRDIAGWIDDIASEPVFNGSFDRQLGGARDWIDESVVRQYRGGNVSLLGEHGIALDAWYTGGARRTGLENRWIVQELAANKLLLRPRVVKMAAYYALSLICECLMSRDKKYQALGAQARNMALTMLAGSILEIDINGDGYGEVPINFSSTNTLLA